MESGNELLQKLQNVKTGKEFWEILESIYKNFRFKRNRGYADIDSIGLVDESGHRYGNPAPLTLYHGEIKDDAYVSYNVSDGYHIGKCKLRQITKFLKLIPID